MGKIIEFFGPPGSGKTTLAKSAYAHLKNEGIEISDFERARYFAFKKWLSIPKNWVSKTDEKNMKRLQSVLDVLPDFLGRKLFDCSFFSGMFIFRNDLAYEFIIENPDLINEVIKNIDRRHGPKEAKKRLYRFYNDFFKYQLAKDYIKNPIIFHEAFCKHISSAHSLFRTGEIPEGFQADVQRFTELISDKIDYAFYVRADFDTCLERQSKRGYIVGEKLDLEKKRKDFMIRLETSEIIHRTLKKNGVKSFRIENDEDFKKADETIKKRLDEVIPELRG